MFYYIARFAVYILARVLYRVRFEGLENVPRDRGFILVSNHISNFDPIFIAVKVKPQCFFMAKEELFRNPFAGLVLRGLGAFPVSRGKGDTAAVEKAIGYVKEGKVVAIFPEGHRSPDGKLQKLKSGAAVIAAETGGGLQPCVVKKGPKKGLRAPVTVRYGKFISHEELGLTGRNPSQIRAASRLLTNTLTGLLEETNV